MQTTIPHSSFLGSKGLILPKFTVNSPYQPAGDQAAAIETLSRSIIAGNQYQTLLGVTGSGKTYTMAKVIEKTGRPTLIMTHNKTLAAQLYSEFKSFFPTTMLSISSATMTTISLKPTCLDKTSS